jgi:catalase
MHKHDDFIFGTGWITVLLMMILLYHPGTSFSALPKNYPKKDSNLHRLTHEDQSDEHILLSKRKKNRNYYKNLTPEEKEKIQKKYKEWQSLPPKEKEKIRRRMKQYRKMSPSEQELYQQRYKQWQHLSPKERKKLQKDLESWENLSPQEKNAIRQRFKP